ncbi:hypothetical protein V491_08025 [Pseudogymnoascus sp. VKM F-3775]|nr:hypothetical protein V491_08025 [Pseudogymnoascus sp. VKM F-3775]
MSNKATLYWHTGPSHVAATGDQYFLLTMDDIVDRKNQVENERAKLADSEWLLDLLDVLKGRRKRYPERQQIANNATKKSNFKNHFMKYFTGDEKEREFLTALRLDIVIILCITVTPTQFKRILHKGLEGAFAEVANSWHALMVPRWAAEMASSTIKSESTIKPQEAKQLQEGLELYLSRDTQQATNYTAKKSLPTTPSIDTHNIDANESHERLNKEHTQTRESYSSQPPSAAWQILPLPTPNKTNAEVGALPPLSSHLSQPASTIGYCQNWPIHEQFPPGPNRASDSTSSIPSSLLINSFENYMQETHLRASKGQRDGDGWPIANTSLPTTPSVDTHNTGADESFGGSNKEHTQTRESYSSQPPSPAWRTLPPPTPNETSTETGALPPPSSHLSQPASTTVYNSGHSQNWPSHKQFPQGPNQAPDSLFNSSGSYIQVHASKRRRVGDESPTARDAI